MSQVPAEPGPDFGTHTLPGPVEALRGLADRLPGGRFGGWGVSAIRRLCLALRHQPFDVTVFGSQRARLYPSDNRCEKRVFAGAGSWDGAERAFLDRLVADHPGPDFAFVDAGANVGLHTLSVRAACQRRGLPLRALAVEPDPVNLSRLRFNLAASGAAEVRVAPVALAGAEGEVRLTATPGNRGEIRVDAAGETSVPARPLARLVAEAGLTGIDAMKMDIEGMETEVLEAFLADAPAALHPRILMIETGRAGNASLLSRLGRAGYAPRLSTRMNTILGLAQPGKSRPGTPRTKEQGPGYGQA